MAPKTEPNVAIAAYLNDFDVAPKHKAISRTSGGIGKKLDSIKANMKRATTPQGVSAQCKIQSYIFLIIFTIVFFMLYYANIRKK